MNRNLLAYILAGLGALLGVLLVFGIVIGIGWPWWVGIFLLVGMAGMALVAVILRKFLLRKKEQEFVSQIIEQDNAYIRA
jgi:type VI secretion system protein ImpL